MQIAERESALPVPVAALVMERSQKIVAAADALLEEEGLEGLTIRAVLKRTGLARRAFYERFAGKDDLILAVFEQTIRSAALYFGDLVGAVENPLERLKLIVTGIVLGRHVLDKAERDRADRRAAALSREHLRLAESRPADLKRALDPLIALLASQLSEGMDARIVRPAAPHRMATLVYNLVSTTVHAELLAQEAGQPHEAGRTELAADIWEFCRRAIAV